MSASTTARFALTTSAILLIAFVSACTSRSEKSTSSPKELTDDQLQEVLNYEEQTHLLKTIGARLLAYSRNSAFSGPDVGRLPPPVVIGEDGEPKSSWRFQITKQIALLMDVSFGARWNAEINQQWARRFAKDYFLGGDWWDLQTNVLAITGTGTAFDPDHNRLAEMDADTILLVETRNSGLHWMEPGDFDIESMPRTINDHNGKGISGFLDEGFRLVFADGSVWIINYDVPFDALALFLTVQGAKQHDREQILGPYRHFPESVRSSNL